jgi:hypothetical protein
MGENHEVGAELVTAFPGAYLISGIGQLGCTK